MMEEEDVVTSGAERERGWIGQYLLTIGYCRSVDEQNPLPEIASGLFSLLLSKYLQSLGQLK